MKLLELLESINGKRLLELDASSRQFRAWFGGSKVVDDDGNPMVMYHGTNSFKPFKKLRGLSHFGTLGAAETILQYGTASFEDAYPARMYPVYLKIENPLEIKDDGEDHNAMEYTRAVIGPLLDLGVRQELSLLLAFMFGGVDPDRFREDYGYPPEIADVLEKIPREEAKRRYKEFGDMSEWKRMLFLIKYLGGLGFDGFVYINRIEDSGSTSWVPFRSSQIRYVYDESITESLDEVYTTMEVASKTQTWDSFFDEMQAAWIGGVADFGNPDAARVIQTHPEYYEYHDQLQQAVTRYLGDPFTAYRLMAQDQVEEWQSGADMPAVAVSIEKRVAVAFRNVAGNKGRDDLILVELSIPAEAVIMLGHPGEHELVIDPNHISANEIKPLRESILIEGFISSQAAAKAIAMDDELFDVVAGYTTWPDIFDDYPEQLAKFLNILKSVKPFKKRLYRGEMEYEYNDWQPYDDHTRGFTSWAANEDVPRKWFNEKGNAIKYTDGPIQAVSLSDIADMRMRLRPGESHYAGGQAEYFVLEPVQRKVIGIHESLLEALGPHEGKELDMMLRGKKPIAMIDMEMLTNREEAGWWHAVATKKLSHRIGINITRRADYFTLPGEEWRADKVREVFQGVRDKDDMEVSDHIALGKLFGYSDEDIEDFVSRIKPQVSETTALRHPLVKIVP